MARGLDKKESSLMFREISPPHRWDEDSDSHHLRLTLPGFASADVTLNLDKYGHLVVRGSRQVTEHKYLSFEETFDVPDDADLEQAGGRFENDHIYRILIPKKTKQTNHDDHHHHHGGDSNTTPVGTPLNKPHNSNNKIAFFIAILIIAIYAANWLNN